MQPIVHIFWNQGERRLRAFWRLSGQLILVFLFTLPLMLLTPLVALGYLLAQDTVPITELADPLVLQAYLAQSPVMAIVSSFVTLIAILLSTWIAGRFLDRRRFSDFGLRLSRDWWIDFGFGLLLGALLVTLIFLIQLFTGWIKVTGTLVTHNQGMVFPLAILVYLAMFVAVGIYEELLFRGYQLQNLAEGLRGKLLPPQLAVILATLLSSTVFGVMHMTNPNSSLVSTLNIIMAGILLLATGYILTGELAIPIGVHITWNFFMGNIFGFPVSGLDVSATTLISTQPTGPALWTGGAFGPEAGLVGLFAMLLGGVLTALWVKVRYGSLGICQKLAEPPAELIKLSIEE